MSKNIKILPEEEEIEICNIYKETGSATKYEQLIPKNLKK